MDPLILGIETSCDETAAALVRGRSVLSNVIATQIAMHAQWGGVVPEAAARAHVEAIIPVIREALGGTPLNRINAIAVTNRPGLVGALSVGVTAAKALARSLSKPLLGIHHLEGHLCSVLGTAAEIVFPHLALIVSGGHTEIVRVNAWGNYEILGQTIDDAAGEAFDKSSRVLGLGFPGGLAIQNAATGGSSKRYALPQGLSGDTLNFSFSGLKTAVLRLAESEGKNLSVTDAAASVQEAIVKVLVERTVRAAVEFELRQITLVGGVSANLALRSRLEQQAQRLGIDVVVPPLDLSTDNAAMIGLAGAVRFAQGQRDPLSLDVFPNADLPN